MEDRRREQLRDRCSQSLKHTNKRKKILLLRHPLNESTQINLRKKKKDGDHESTTDITFECWQEKVSKPGAEQIVNNQRSPNQEADKRKKQSKEFLSQSEWKKMVACERGMKMCKLKRQIWKVWRERMKRRV